MVFANSILCYTNGTSSGESQLLVPSANDIAICDKTRDSITLVNLAFPKQSELGNEGHNA